MAKVVLCNTREHNITISFTASPNKKDDKQRLIPTHPTHTTIPRSSQPDLKSPIVPGREVIDSEMLELARAKYPVVEGYFKRGWLYIDDTVEALDDDERTSAAAEDAERLRNTIRSQGEN